MARRKKINSQHKVVLFAVLFFISITVLGLLAGKYVAQNKQLSIHISYLTPQPSARPLIRMTPDTRPAWQTEDVSTWQDYTSTPLKLSLKYPTAWQVRENAADPEHIRLGYTGVFENPELEAQPGVVGQMSLRLNVCTIQNSKPADCNTPQMWIDDMKKSMKEVHVSKRVVSGIEGVQIEGYTGHINGSYLYIRQVFLPVGHDILSMSVDNQDTFKVFDTVLATIRINK